MASSHEVQKLISSTAEKFARDNISNLEKNARLVIQDAEAKGLKLDSVSKQLIVNSFVANSKLNTEISVAATLSVLTDLGFLNK
ncbi:hypothetical protein LZ578_08795 [Jeotgalibaca sp. MA1X17-3]|uniref:hypothetical protein n=1 Tax=Jeotgalibaca sp. MA1X17-3 TaxID=2908211 RepID=UPI001F1EE726|nr:hypothetical protein [Jeotgalibaca sp. MA1X17-3]UJF15095.1 hypothetical protein LZ578_08795 [Jeotgalibaca sp. MA1X17-3]